MGVISIILYVLMTLVSQNVLYDMIAAVGFPIAFYYAETGYSCVWWYRKRLLDDWRTFFGAGLLPLLGALMLSGMFIKACFYYWHPGNSYSKAFGVGGTFLAAIGGMLVGVVLMIIWRVLRPAYFKGEVLTKETPVLVPED